MYGAQSLKQIQDDGFVALHEQLEHDATGELRDRLTAELREAARDIEAALGEKPGKDQAEVLRELLGAVRLGEDVLGQVWDSFRR